MPGPFAQSMAPLLADLSQGLREFAVKPFRPGDGVVWYEAWLTNWRDFWLGEVLDDRFVVLYFLPLVPILLLFRGDALRKALIATGLAFMFYVFGALYTGLWVLLCLALFRLAERFALECRRTDVLPYGPPLAAWLIIGGGYIVTMLVPAVQILLAPRLPWLTTANDWLWHHLPWIFPLGARGLAWEPWLRYMRLPPQPAPFSDSPFQLLPALFFNVHNIGTAYLAVRMLHYFADIRRGLLPPALRTRLNFLAYTCYAPTLIQGPIERYQVFQEEMDTCHLRRRWANCVPAGARIVRGLLKGLFATLYLKPIFWSQMGIGRGDVYWRHPEQIESFALLYFGVFLQIFYLYLEFSGMSDIAVGIGWLFGYRQAENFRMPFLATSLRDFWRRWHITLSAILRDYLYIPLGGNRRHQTLNLCVTFVACGLWHRITFQVILWGVVMGVLVSINQHWALWMKRLDERATGLLPAIRRGALRLRPLPTVLYWLVTQHAFVFSMLFFFGSLQGLNVAWEIIRLALGLPLGPLHLFSD